MKKLHIFRKFIFIILIMLLSTPPSTFATKLQHKNFKDIDINHWATPYIDWAVSEGLIVGFPDGTFRQKDQITEEQFAKVLVQFVTNIDDSKLVQKEGEWWSDRFYKALEPYKLPFRGQNDNVIRCTGLTRARVARLIAAKNGFNLTERQAIYYMYENDLAEGIIEGELSFESYDPNGVVLREHIPAFFQRLNIEGHTTFLGKESPVSGRDIGGIDGVSQETVEITDEMFDELARERGKENPKKTTNNSKYDFANKIADKYGMNVDDSSSTGFAIKLPENNYNQFWYTPNDYGFDVRIFKYKQNKQMGFDLLKATGRITDKEIKLLEDYIENDYLTHGVPTLYDLGIAGISIEGDYDILTIRIVFRE